MALAMIAANVPWYKLQVPQFKSFLEKYFKHNIPDESTLRKNYLNVCYIETLEKIRADIGDSYIWIGVDETMDAVGRYIANLIVSKLDSENPAKAYLIYCKPLEQTNHSTVALFINDGLKVLWPNGVEEEKVLLLYTDAAAYMLKAG